MRKFSLRFSLNACVYFFASFSFFFSCILFSHFFFFAFARLAFPIFILFKDYFQCYKEIKCVELNCFADASICYFIILVK